MQPITISTEVISKLIVDCTSSKSLGMFHKFSENLEKFHEIYIDKHNHNSTWYKNFIEVRDRITDHNIKKLFNDLLGPRNLKYIFKDLFTESDIFYELTRMTPDKIGLNCKNQSYKEVKYYDLNTFNSLENNPSCLLFRLPKYINVPPKYKFNDINFFNPYLREATKIEFCDPYLFKDSKYENDIKFMWCILKNCTNVSSIELHCEPNPQNILQKNFEKKLKELFPKTKGGIMKKYKGGVNDVNHDRFILIDHDRISIRFTTSFNNIQVHPNIYIAKDSFLIEFSKGRKYYD